MTSLTVKLHNEEEEKALIAFLDKLHYEYEENEEIDTTEYLLSTETMKDHLEKGIQEAKDGRVSSIPLDDLWK